MQKIKKSQARIILNLAQYAAALICLMVNGSNIMKMVHGTTLVATSNVKVFVSIYPWYMYIITIVAIVASALWVVSAISDLTESVEEEEEE